MSTTTTPSDARLFDAVVRGFEEARDELEAEQAVHGLDSWLELDLHAVLASSLSQAGFFVAREQRYPGHRTKKQRTSGRRCDLVVTDGAPLLLEGVEPDPFAPATATPEVAAWIEVKLLKQFRPGGANHGWDEGLLHPPTTDLLRLADEAGLGARALLLVLFTASAEVAEHDLDVWAGHVVAAGLRLGPPLLRHLPIVDRYGNRVCSLAWMPVLRRF